MEYLDLNDSRVIDDFKKNLSFLINEAKQNGKITRFAIVRDEDFLPLDWKWRSYSMYTQMEYSDCFFSSTLRDTLRFNEIKIQRKEKENNRKATKSFFNKFFSSKTLEHSVEIPPTEKEIEWSLSKFDNSVGKVLVSSRYRLTKHFTINTPLSHTGNYNSVNSDRNFVVIDDASLFFDSPYAFTANYHDCYIDTTHEPLAISENAMVLIAKEKYENIIKNPEISKILSERKLIVFSGDEGLAINIVLAQNGYLPVRFGLDYAEHDCELSQIIEQSMIIKCDEKNIPYDIGHNEHFSNSLSDNSEEFSAQNKLLYDFLIEKLPGHEQDIPTFPLEFNFSSGIRAKNIINSIGTESLLNIIQQFNEFQKEIFERRNQEFLLYQQSLTVQQLECFRKIALLIRKTIANDKKSGKNIDNQTTNLLKSFYAMGNFDVQLTAAHQLEEILKEKEDILKM